MWIKVTFLLVYFPSLNIVFIEENTGFNTPGITKSRSESRIMANILVYLLVYFIFICIFLIILKVGGL